jgi:hypothetical protein
MNTTRLYNAVSAFVQARADAREEFQVMARRYERARGSQMYTDEMSKARKKREEAIAAAQTAARQEIRETLQAMAEKASKIKMLPPTEEQLRILQLLSMKETITAAECAGAANAMEGNAAALSLLDELANKAGVLHSPYAKSQSVKSYDPETARQTIKELGAACYEIIENTSGAKKPALLAKQWHQNKFGGTFDPDELPQEEPYKDEDDFYMQMNIPLSAFSAAVD